MRILTVGSLYPPHHFGGYELVWQTAVRALRAAGHDVRVVCVSDRRHERAGEGEEPAVFRELRWYCRDYHAFPTLGARERLRIERHNHRVLGRHLREHRPDVVSWWAMGAMSLSLIERVRRTGIPACGWVNNDWLIAGPHVDQWIRFFRRRSALAGPAEHVTRIPASVDLAGVGRWVFCSETMRSASLKHHPELVDTAVAHQGPGREFTPQPDAPWRGRLVYVGRVAEGKGLSTLIDAVLAMGHVSLEVVGDAESAAYERSVRARAKAAGARIAFRPAVARAQLPAVYAAADAVIFPVQWQEPWGLVPLEAMAVGRPVIATGRGGSSEYLAHEENSLLFPAGDAAALERAVARLAADGTLRARLRSGGFETARRITEAKWRDIVVEEHRRTALTGPRRARATRPGAPPPP